MKSFFDKVDLLGIAEEHIQKIRKLEEKDSAALLREYKAVRRELRDRLEVMGGKETFTSAKLRSVLVQVELALEAQGKTIRDGIKDAGRKAATNGIEDLLKEISLFDEEFTGAVTPINLNVALAASDAANFLFNQYDTSVDAYTAEQHARIAQQLTQSVIAGDSYHEVVSKLGKYGIGEEWKVERLARTELHNIYNVGKLKGMEETKKEDLPDLMKAIIHPLDNRTADDSKHLAKLNPIVEIDEPFEYTWNGKKRVFMAPPDRPNDRGILIPYRKAWGSDDGSPLFKPGEKKSFV